MTAINSFNNLGLFPENITIDEIKQLVYGETQNLDSIRFKDETLTEFDNILCHVTGESNYTFFFAPALLLLASAVCFPEGFILASLLSFFKYHESLSLFILLLLLSILFAVPAAILFLISLSSILSILPVAIGGICSLGEIFSGYETEYRPASGWISTMGLNGKKNYTGEFYGHLGWNFLICPGIVGFTGLHILLPLTPGNVFYFGSALRVGISTEPY